MHRGETGGKGWAHLLPEMKLSSIAAVEEFRATTAPPYAAEVAVRFRPASATREEKSAEAPPPSWAEQLEMVESEMAAEELNSDATAPPLAATDVAFRKVPAESPEGEARDRSSVSKARHQ